MGRRKAAQPAPWNPSPRVRAFLAAYRITCSITKAAEAAGIRREAHYRLKERSAEYALAFQEARRDGGDYLEDEAARLALEGERQLVIYHGGLVMVPADVTRLPGDDNPMVPLTRHKKSERMLELLLKARKPNEYRERVEHEVGPELGKKFDGTFEQLLAL